MNEDLKKFEGRSEPEEKSLSLQQPSFFSAIERLAANPAVDVEKIKQMMEMQEHILDRNAKQAFNAAMVRAQAKMPIVPKDNENTQTGSMYSGYETLIKYCKPVYTNEGFSVTFSQGFGTPENPLAEGHNRIVADVMHEEGHTKIVFADIPIETTGPKGGVLMTKTHATGSGFSYGRSYLIRLIFNIPTGNDDDGNAAGDKDKKIKPQEQWEIKCAEAGETASSVEDMAKWWADNGKAIKKELTKVQAATIFQLVVVHKNRLKKPQECEPGSDDQ